MIPDSISHRAAALRPVLPLLLAMLCSACFLGEDEDDNDDHHDHGPEAVFVADGSTLKAYGLNNGEQLEGEVQDVSSPADMYPLDNGVIALSLSGGEILFIDAESRIEKARLNSSTIGGTRATHAYISPKWEGTQARYWLTLHDGDGSAATNAATLVDINPESDGYLTIAGEVALGIGHHKAAFSYSRQRMVVSNISDCNDVLSVFDFSDPGNITKLATLTAADAGFDGVNLVCDPTYQAGFPASPHGMATSKASGKVYNNNTGLGHIVVVDVDAEMPTFKLLETGGSGAGYTAPHPDGGYIYSLQSKPREGDGGEVGQIGQLVVVDASADAVVREVPLFYKGPDAADTILGKKEETAGPGKILAWHGNQNMFILTAGGFGVDTARVHHHLVMDISDPANPVQKPSIQAGAGTGHVPGTLSSGGKYLLIGNNAEGTVSQFDAAALSEVRKIATGGNPSKLATWGAHEGPGYQSGPKHEEHESEH